MAQYRCLGFPQHNIICDEIYDSLEGNFYKDEGMTSGHKSRCKKCTIAMNKVHRHEKQKKRATKNEDKKRHESTYAEHELEHSITIKGSY